MVKQRRRLTWTNIQTFVRSIILWGSLLFISYKYGLLWRATVRFRLIDGSIDRSIDRLIDGLIDWLIDWLIYLFIYWSIDLIYFRAVHNHIMLLVIWSVFSQWQFNVFDDNIAIDIDDIGCRFCSGECVNWRRSSWWLSLDPKWSLSVLASRLPRCRSRTSTSTQTSSVPCSSAMWYVQYEPSPFELFTLRTSCN